MPEAKTPLVSVLVPAFNAEAHMAACLESALRQTWSHLEVIVVDDGSTDRTADVAASFAARGVKTIRQPNSGASAARNAGIKAASGEIIQFLDADDLLAPDKIEVQLAAMARDDYRYLTSGEWARFYADPTEALFRPDALWRDLKAVDWLTIALSRNLMMHPAAWLVPGSLVERAGAWDESLSLNDDGEYFARVMLESDLVRFCPGARTYYRSGDPKSLSARKSDQAWHSALCALDSIRLHLLSREDRPSTRTAVANAYQRLIFSTYPACRSLRKVAAQRIADLGGAQLAPEWGGRTKLISRLFGWRVAATARYLMNRR